MKKKWTLDEVCLKRGDVFGRWVVLEYAGMTSKGRNYWCICDCGTKRIVAGANLRSGMSKSCGCKRKEALSLPPDVAAKNHMFSSYKCSARNRKKEWNLTREQFEILISGNCFFCGLPPSSGSWYHKGDNNTKISGVDRLDNSFGYTLENSVSCCKTCNYAKRIMTVEEFKSWITRVYNHVIGIL
jgi:hypothetical protein